MFDATGTVYSQLTQFQSRPWFQTYSTSGTTRDAVGEKTTQNYTVNTVLDNGITLQTWTNESSIPGAQLPPNFGPVAPQDKGMLGTYSENRFYLANVSVNTANLTNVIAAIVTDGVPFKLNLVPYWPTVTEQVDAGVNANYSANSDIPKDQQCKNNNTAQQCALDDVLGYQINAIIAQLTNLNKTVLNNPGAASLQDQLNFLAAASAITNQMPYGAVEFQNVDPQAAIMQAQFQIGTDRRIANAANFPSQWYRNLQAWSNVINTFYRSLGPQFSNASIVHSYRAMPQYSNTGISLPVAAAIGRILYPWGVSFLLPIFVIIMVKEKEDRILQMMRMVGCKRAGFVCRCVYAFADLALPNQQNGMKSFTYYLTLYIHFLILGIISSLIFLIAGYAFGMEMFRRTSWLVLLIVFFVWANLQVAMAFFLSAFFKKSRTALGELGVLGEREEQIQRLTRIPRSQSSPSSSCSPRLSSRSPWTSSSAATSLLSSSSGLLSLFTVASVK